MTTKDTILTVNIVRDSLLNAMKLHSEELGIPLKGLVLVQKSYAAAKTDRARDTSGVFTEIICDFDDLDELQRVLKPYQHRLLAATYRFESTVLPFRQIIPFIPYVFTPSETSLLWTTQKPLMRDRLHSYDKNLVPRYKNIYETDVPNVHRLIVDFTYPLIVKPSNLASSLLVTRCNTSAELDSCLQKTFAIIDEVFIKQHRKNKPSVLIEEMMQGDIYSTDVYITHDGEISCLPLVAVKTGHDVGLPGFYGYEQLCPAHLSETETQLAYGAATAAVRALNLRSSAAHVELFHTATGWKIIEVGARIGGLRDTLYRLSYGMEHSYNDLAIRMGTPPKMPGEVIAHAALIEIFAESEGRIEAIVGLEDARKIASVHKIQNRLAIGDEALFSTNGGRNVVYAVLCNKNLNVLHQEIAQVRELIKITIKN